MKCHIYSHCTKYCEDEDIKNGLHVIAVVSRHGVDGVTLKQSSKSVYAWKQAMLLQNELEIDENGLLTPWEHPSVVTGFLEYFNSSEVQEEFSWSCKAVVFEDKTQCPKRPLDKVLLDKEVVNVMVYLYQDSVTSMKRYSNDILSMFWSNIEHGKAVMSEFCKSDDDDSDMKMMKTATVFMILRPIPIQMTMKKLRPIVALMIATALKTSLLMKVMI